MRGSLTEEMKAHKVAFALVALATLARLILAAKTPVVCFTYETFDDGLLLNYADSMAHGGWLGPYGRFTLVKNAGYPMIIAFAARTHIPYQVMFMLLWMIACIVAARALEPLVRDVRVRLGVYLVLLWIPVLFMYNFFERTYRFGIVLPFVLGIFAGYFGLYLRRDRPARQLVPWSVLAGLTLAYFYLIMESSKWVLPFVAGCSVVCLVLWVLDLHRKRIAVRGLVARTALLALPLAMLWGWCTLEAGVNDHFYGVRINNNRTQGSYSQVIARLATIDAGETNRDVVISRAALGQALDASPTLVQMRDAVWTAWDTWGTAYDNWDKPEGSTEVPGDIGYWALMDAYDAAYHYTDGKAQEAYWARICDELDAAFADGRLLRKEGLTISGGTQPMTAEDVAPWLRETFAFGRKLAFYQADGTMVDAYVISQARTEDILERQRYIRDLLGGNAIIDDPSDAVYVESHDFLVREATVGRALVQVHRALVFVALAAAALLLCRDIRKKDRDGLRTALLAAALLLSTFVLVAGVVWSVGYFMRQMPAVRDSAFSSYAGACYVLFCYVECILIGRVADVAVDAKRERA